MSAETPDPNPSAITPSVVVSTNEDHGAPVAIAVSSPVIAPADATPTKNVQFWLTLTPLLSILITAITLLINAYLSVNQSRRTEQATEASEWRQALNKLSEGSGSELATMLQMESFFSSRNESFREDARSIAATLVSDSPNPYAFDVVVFRMVPGTTEKNQGDLLLIDQALLKQALQLFAAVQNRPPTRDLLHDPDFQTFLISPETLIKDPAHAPQLKQAMDLNWKMDSVSSAITAAWATHNIQPGKSNLDLTDVVFLNQNETQFDFTGLDLTRTAFLGKCIVPANLPASGIVACKLT